MSRLHIAGIKFRVHPLFWLIAMMAAVTGQFMELITLFALVLMHELGHVFVALAVGWRVTSIELLPFGGVAKVDDMGSTKAVDEIKVALAGPAVNIVMMGLGYVLWQLGLWQQPWAEFFILSNALIGGFNLLPILPLDGGKVLQAVMSLWVSYYRTIYYSIGWSCCSLFILVSGSFLIPGRWNLAVICVYLMIENRLAWKQGHYQFLRFLLMKRDLQMQHTFPIVIRTVPFDLRLGKAVKLIKKETFHHFHVIDHRSKRSAIVCESHLLTSFFQKKPSVFISEIIKNG